MWSECALFFWVGFEWVPHWRKLLPFPVRAPNQNPALPIAPDEPRSWPPDRAIWVKRLVFWPGTPLARILDPQAPPLDENPRTSSLRTGFPHLGLKWPAPWPESWVLISGNRISLSLPLKQLQAWLTLTFLHRLKGIMAPLIGSVGPVISSRASSLASSLPTFTCTDPVIIGKWHFKTGTLCKVGGPHQVQVFTSLFHECLQAKSLDFVLQCARKQRIQHQTDGKQYLPHSVHAMRHSTRAAHTACYFHANMSALMSETCFQHI